MSRKTSQPAHETQNATAENTSKYERASTTKPQVVRRRLGCEQKKRCAQVAGSRRSSRLQSTDLVGGVNASSASGASASSASSSGTTPATAGSTLAAAAAEARASTFGGHVSALLSTYVVAPPAAGSCTWMHGTTVGLGADEHAVLAWMLADAIMTSRCGPSPSYQRWRNAALNGTKLTGREHEGVAAVIHGNFGVPGDPRAVSHIQAHVAEWLWYLNATEIVDATRALLYLEEPKFNVFGQGGDGFAVWQAASDSTTSFRLWEIKNHTGQSNTAVDVIGTAARQIDTKGARYLAQLTADLSRRSDDVGVICREVLDLWHDGDNRAGLGVAVTSDNTPATTTCFDNLAGRFPQFATAGQVEGLLVTVTNLELLAEDVRGYLWTAL